MPTTLTLIAKPGGLVPEHIAQVREALAKLGIITPSEPDWLSPGEASVLKLPDRVPAMLLERASAALASESIDVVVQSTEHRRKRLLVADMDSTIVTCECIDELADAVGLKDKVAAITERAMRGEIAFEPALIERVALLKGLPLAEVEKVYAERVRLTPGAKTLVATMRANGAEAVLVSGGFTFFTLRVAKVAGFDHHQGNVLEIEGGKLTGRVVPPILGRDAKRAALAAHAARMNIPRAATLAVGDGANDLTMIEAAGLGVAYHAKPRVAAVAPAVINHGDLTALLFIQGYRRDQFAG